MEREEPKLGKVVPEDLEWVHPRQRRLLQITQLPCLVCRLGMHHLRTRPYTPRTNGKAERLVQTSLREWAYARAYDSSKQRAHTLGPWLCWLM